MSGGTTVIRDQRQSGASDEAPGPVTGLDGKTYTRNPITPEMQPMAESMTTGGPRWQLEDDAR